MNADSKEAAFQQDWIDQMVAGVRCTAFEPKESGNS